MASFFDKLTKQGGVGKLAAWLERRRNRRTARWRTHRRTLGSGLEALEQRTLLVGDWLEYPIDQNFENPPVAAQVASAQPAANTSSAASSTAETFSSDQETTQQPSASGKLQLPPSTFDPPARDFLVRRDPKTGRLIFIPSATAPPPQQAKEPAASQVTPEKERSPILLNLSPLFPAK